MALSTHERDVKAYIRAVKSGKRIAGKCERDAVQRYLDDMCNKDAKGWIFDRKSAKFACEFFALMKITQGKHAGEPFKLYGWQQFIVWNLFGWRVRATGARRFRQALIQVARGNGKTPFGAGLLFLAGGFMPDCVPRGDNYICATKKDQAKLAFSDLKAILATCPDLAELCEIHTHDFSIKENGCTFQAVSSDGKTADGWRILTCLRDEYHAWDNTTKHNDFDLKLKTALTKFDSSLLITITTAGNESSKKWIAYDKIARLTVDRDSDVNMDSMFVYIAELDEDDDLFDIENYHKSNPMMASGIVDKQIISDMIDAAKILPDIKSMLERYHANRRIQTSSKPFTPTVWGACGGTTPQPGRKLPCGGLDLGGNDDLSSLATVWKLDDHWLVEWDIWIPRHGRRNVDEEPMRTWIEQGWITCTDTEWTDFDAIYARILERRDMHGWHSIAFDKWSARQMSISLVNDGIDVFAFEQSNRKFNEPCRELEQSIFEKRFHHGGNPVLAWCASNYMTRSDINDHKRPDKEASEDKIDPMVACIMGISENLFSEPPFVSKYETKEPVVFGVTDSGSVDLLESIIAEGEKEYDEANDPFFNY